MTAEQADLVATARRNIRSARILARDGDFDTAVSRAYYAMFYLAEAVLLTKGLAFSKHSGVIGAFGKEFTKSGALPLELHSFLIDAGRARNIADYQVLSHLTDAEAEEHIAHAEQFLAVAEEFSGRP